MKKIALLIVVLSLLVSMSACSQGTVSQKEKKELHVGIMLSDVGLGDQSFSDAGFAGLEKARDELGVIFDYKELSETGDYVKGLSQLAEEGNDIVIGLGFMVQESIEEVAKKYPKTKFLLIDSVSDLENVYSVTFKEEEGSYLIGLVAGMKTKTNTVGFVGGMDVPLIRKFAAGFMQGVKDSNPEANVIIQYSGDFGNAALGEKQATELISQKVDFIYPAAGLTGTGVLKAAQQNKVYSFGVDSDQYFLAEKSVVTSMLKKIDVAIYSSIKEYAEEGKFKEKNLVLGLKEEGVGLADIRLVDFNDQEKQLLEDKKNEISNGNIKVNSDY